MGGNVSFGSNSATRINVLQIGRQQTVEILNSLLDNINQSYSRDNGYPLWDEELFSSKEFISGSGIHLFNTTISDLLFVLEKPTMGDVDVKVDQTFPLLKWFGQLHDNKLIGWKNSGNQIITLWHVEGMNIQIDFELVEFQNKRPTEWASFCRSSDWMDVMVGIKGVFHKYAIRAMTSLWKEERNIRKGERIEVQDVGKYAFSVDKGFREKIEEIEPNVFQIIPVKNSVYCQDVKTILSILLRKDPSTDELEQFNSFVGIMKIIKSNYSLEEQIKCLDGFANLIWGKGAQSLSKDEMEDYKVKNIAFAFMSYSLGINLDISNMVKNYYSDSNLINGIYRTEET